MKIRWNNTGLRVRIGPTEMDELLSGGSITENFPLPGGWSVTLCPTNGKTGIQFTNAGTLMFSLAHADRERLAAAESEGVYFEMMVNDGEIFRYYVEKDFPCLHPRPAELLNPVTETFAPTSSFLARSEKE